LRPEFCTRSLLAPWNRTKSNADHHHIQHAHILKCELILAQLAEALIFVDHHRAGRRLQIAAENFHKGGFAATVCADQALTVAVVEFDGYVFKQGFAPNCMVMLAVESM
jgi:hypothetical protein